MECVFHLMHKRVLQRCACRLAANLERATLPKGKRRKATGLIPSRGGENRERSVLIDEGGRR